MGEANDYATKLTIRYTYAPNGGGYFQGRYNQEIAIEPVLESIAAGKKRILLTLATGTGKTHVRFP